VVKRLRLIAIIVTVLLASCLALHLALNREPRYQGRSLTEWLKYYQASIGHDGTNTEAIRLASTNAVKQIGSLGIPFLLRKLSKKENVLERRLQSWIDRQTLVNFTFANLYGRYLAEDGFAILGNNAVSAVPDLVQLTKHPDAEVRSLTLFCLYDIRPQQDIFLPVLLRTAQDTDKSVRGGTAQILSELYPEEAKKAGIYVAQPKLTNLLDSISLPPPKQVFTNPPIFQK
jgi:hypothetical protein